MRNRIINGAMVINQRALGSVNPDNGAVTIDRWQAGVDVTGKITVNQSSIAPTGFTNSFIVTSSSAYTPSSAEAFNIRQNIEGFNTADLMWGTANAKTVTLSFWVRSSLTGTFGGSIVNSAYDRSYPFSYTVSSANTWTQISVTIVGDTSGTWIGATNGAGIRVLFGLGAGSTKVGAANAWASAFYNQPTGSVSVVGTNGATFYITGVQLEVGTQATSFEYRQYQQELALCQRYYEKSYDIGTAPATNTSVGRFQQTGSSNSSGDMTFAIRFAVQKRTAPTMTAYSSGGTINQWNRTGTGGTALATLNWEFQATGGTAAYIAVGSNSTVSAVDGQWIASAEL
jgi:hypothetical protein